MTRTTRHLPTRPNGASGVPLLEGTVIAGSATLLMLPVVVATMGSLLSLTATAAVAVAASALVLSRRAATGEDWVAVRRYGRWSVLPASALTGASSHPTQHGGHLVLHGADGRRMSLRRSEAQRLLPTIAPVVALSPCGADRDVRALVG